MISGWAKERLGHIGFIVIVYILVTWFTNPWTQGDTVDYADSVFAYHTGYHLKFWEFGHLLWRPFGWVLFRVFNPLTSLIFGADDRAKITFTLMASNWIASLACLLLLRSLTERVCNRPFLVDLAAIGLLFSSSFLDYGQTGSAYSPGLALILTGGWLLVKYNEKPTSKLLPVLAAFAFAGGITFWIPMVLIVPACAALPILIGTWNRNTVRTVIVTLVLMSGFVAVAYVAVILNLGINNFMI